MPRRIKKEGNQFGLVKVLSYDGAGKYRCECQGCGKIYLVDSQNIGRNNACKDCYIKSIKNDLAGREFGRLIARSPVSKKRGRCYRSAWVCDCTCGKQVIVDTDSLLSGTTRSCGCLGREKDVPEAIKKEFVSGTQISKIKSIPNKANKTGVVGVNWDKSRNKWQASIRFQRKKIYLGRYDQFEDAVKARKNGENKYFENILKSTD